MELTYQQYMELINNSISDSAIVKSGAQLKPLGHFIKSEEGHFVAPDYSGFTIITPPFLKDSMNVSTYQTLAEIYQKLQEGLNLDKIVLAPTHCFHMTVARLISGDKFKINIMNRYEKAFIQSIHNTFVHADTIPSMQMYIKGLSLFPQGVVGALIEPASKVDYTNLQRFRNIIYNDPILTKFGVERKRRFKGHITLMYIEDQLTPNESSTLTDNLIYANHTFFKEPLGFTLGKAELRSFNNFLNFNRESYWPSYNFNN